MTVASPCWSRVIAVPGCNAEQGARGCRQVDLCHPLMQSGKTKSAVQKATARDVHPLKRYGKPDDVAGLVNWLAGEEVRYA